VQPAKKMSQSQAVVRFGFRAAAGPIHCRPRAARIDSKSTYCGGNLLRANDTNSASR
jgi:hypothetical protein